MPINPEHRARYPADWPARRARVLARAKDRCEACRAPNHTTVWRGEGRGVATYARADGALFAADTGARLGAVNLAHYRGRPVRIVLQVGHVDGVPEHAEDDNLRAWCQRCHLRHDQRQHQRNAWFTRRARVATRDLFGWPVAGEGASGAPA